MAAFDSAALNTTAGLTRTNLCLRVLHRLGDSDEKIWTKTEVTTYLTQAAAEFADRTRCVWDQLFLDDILEVTGQKTTPPSATMDLPVNVLEVERASHFDHGSLESLSPHHLEYQDSRHESTVGEVFGYVWRKDGIRKLRLVRVPPSNPVDIRIDYWRHFEVSCDGSELPQRYFIYLADYVQWRCLTRPGPGLNYKLAQLYKDRWERNVARTVARVGRVKSQRVGRLGGTDYRLRNRPPRPRLPWSYGNPVR
jgi:hypothetical protein